MQNHLVKFEGVLPVSQLSYTIRPLLVSEEKAIILINHALSNKKEDNTDAIKMIADLLDRTVAIDQVTSTKNLNHIDFQYLVGKMAEYSIGEDIEGFVGEEDGRKTFVFNIQKDFQVTGNFELFNKKTSRTVKGYKFFFRTPTITDLITPVDSEELQTISTLMRYLYAIEPPGEQLIILEDLQSKEAVSEILKLPLIVVRQLAKIIADNIPSCHYNATTSDKQSLQITGIEIFF